MVTTTQQADDTAAGHWKSRYLGALETQEQVEREAGSRVGELGSLLVRLSRALPEDQAAALSKRLAALAGALKRRPLDPILSVDVRELQGQVLDVMDGCERERAAMHGALAEAVESLESRCRSRAFRRRLKSFRGGLGRRQPPPGSELVTSLTELQDMVLEALDVPADGPVHCAPVARADEPPPVASAAPVVSDVARDEDGGSAVPAPEVATAAVDWPGVRTVLTDLVARLEVAETLREDVRRVTASLEQDLCEEGLLKVLESVRDLMDSALSGMTQEFQGFLDSVDRRLDALLTGLGQAREDGRAALAMEHELTDSLQTRLSAMRTDAARATRLDELKSSIESHLLTLGRSVETFGQSGDARGSERDANLAAMEQRLREMETESREVRGQLEVQRRLARTDALTGLPNRGAMDERLSREITAARAGGLPLSIALADIDHFKRVNDRYGHQAGDRALQLFAGILSQRIRQSDYCARYGGEEFLLVFPATEATVAASVAEEIRRFVEGCGFGYKGEPVPLTASFGVTGLAAGEEAAGVLERADRALYEAKNGGRNRVALAD